jgi:hypothetical protein
MENQQDVRDTLRGIGIRTGVLAIGGLIVAGAVTTLALKAAEGAVKVSVGLILLGIGGGLAAYEVRKLRRHFNVSQPRTELTA